MYEYRQPINGAVNISGEGVQNLINCKSKFSLSLNMGFSSNDGNIISTYLGLRKDYFIDDILNNSTLSDIGYIFVANNAAFTKTPLYTSIIYEDWDSSKTYSKNDTVEYNNNFYHSITDDNLNNEPTNSEYWLEDFWQSSSGGLSLNHIQIDNLRIPSSCYVIFYNSDTETYEYFKLSDSLRYNEGFPYYIEKVGIKTQKTIVIEPDKFNFYDNTQTYNTGDIVLTSQSVLYDNYYRSLIDNNTTEPNDDSVNWERAPFGDSNFNDYKSGTLENGLYLTFSDNIIMNCPFLSAYGSLLGYREDLTLETLSYICLVKVNNTNTNAFTLDYIDTLPNQILNNQNEKVYEQKIRSSIHTGSSLVLNQPITDKLSYGIINNQCTQSVLYRSYVDNWNNSTEYYIDSIVRYNDKLWKSQENSNSGNIPTVDDNTYWSLLNEAEYNDHLNHIDGFGNCNVLTLSKIGLEDNTRYFFITTFFDLSSQQEEDIFKSWFRDITIQLKLTKGTTVYDTYNIGPFDIKLYRGLNLINGYAIPYILENDKPIFDSNSNKRLFDITVNCPLGKEKKTTKGEVWYKCFSNIRLVSNNTPESVIKLPDWDNELTLYEYASNLIGKFITNNSQTHITSLYDFASYNKEPISILPDFNILNPNIKYYNLLKIIDTTIFSLPFIDIVSPINDSTITEATNLVMYSNLQSLNLNENKTLLNLENFGVSIGQTSTGTVSNPKFEVAKEYTTHFYGKVEIFPVGAIYMSVDPTNPSEYFIGTWVPFAEGRTIFGVKYATSELDDDLDFNQPEIVGGEKEHKLTVAELPSHRHDVLVNPDSSGELSGSDPSGRGFVMRATASGGSVSSTPKTSYVGSTQPHNNIPPYITCYIWKRIA